MNHKCLQGCVHHYEFPYEDGGDYNQWGCKVKSNHFDTNRHENDNECVDYEPDKSLYLCTTCGYPVFDHQPHHHSILTQRR